MSPRSQDFQALYNAYQEEIQTLNDKLVQIDSDLHEYQVVLKTLKTLPDDRKCWRMVDACLVEMNCGKARVTLTDTIQEMTKSAKNLSEKLKVKQQEFDDWKKKNHVRVVRAN